MANKCLEPLTFRGGARARNRVVLAAMTNGQSRSDGSLGAEELHWLDARAAGGFGIITTCASHVSKDGQGWAGALGCFDDRLIPGLKALALAMHRRGALAFAQLFHGGLRADPAVTGQSLWSASAAPDGSCRAATEQDIRRAVGDFAAAAGRARAAEMDGVELHGAHGYLFTQFLSLVENRRTDRWGGSLENRARLLRETTRAVRANAPAPFVVGVRLSPEDFGNAKGLDLDESLQVARWLAEDGADFIHLSLWDVSKNTDKRPREHPLELFRRVLPGNVRLFAAGKIWTREDADLALSLGADAVALGRAAIANPDWPLRAADPGWTPRLPPLTADELRARGLSPKFVEYVRRWKDFVAP
ncbi:MAG: NADH:flavin oxidoreductase [Elusimicrobiota bacterium]